MTPTLYRDTGYTLNYLVEDIKHGNLALPDMQRPFVWSSAKTRDLFDSLYRGYPVGTLMFWETGADVGTRQVGGGDNDRVAKLLIVDGAGQPEVVRSCHPNCTEHFAQSVRLRQLNRTEPQVHRCSALSLSGVRKGPVAAPPCPPSASTPRWLAGSASQPRFSAWSISAATP
jgi:Protein of unknown function DUF262